VTTCLENLEISGNLTAVREMSGISQKKSGKCHGKNRFRENLPKTVYCKLHICVHTCIQYYTVLQKKFTLLLFSITKSDVDRFQ